MAEEAQDVQQESSPDEATQDVEKQEQPKAEDVQPAGDVVPRSRLNEEIAKKKELQEKLDALTPKPEEKPQETPAPSPTPISVEDALRLRNEGYSDSEVLTLVEKSRALGVSMSKLLDDDVFKAGLESKREETKAEQATPAPTAAPSRSVGEKSIKDMSAEELKENWSQVVEKYSTGT